MAHYTARGKGYEVHPRDYHAVIRPTRNAAGASYQYSHAKAEDARTLAVRGTLDELRGLMWRIERGPKRRCSCCGSELRGWVLNDRGRKRLAALRRRREERLSCARC